MKNVLALGELWLGLLFISTCALGFVFLTLRPWLKKYPVKSVFFSVCFIGSALGLYYCWGASSELLHYDALQTVTRSLQKMTTLSQKEAILKEFSILEHKVTYSHVAIAHVGNLYSELGLFERSIQAYEKALALVPEQKEYQLQWIYNHSRLNNGKLPIAVREFAQNLLQHDPSQKELVNLLALDDYRQQRYEEAVKQWQWLLASDQQLSEAKQAILTKAIDNAQQQIGTISSPVVFRIRVDLAAEFKSQLRDQQIVFIYVKDPQQSRPIAVVKRPAKAFPFIVDLDDKHAMMPTQLPSQLTHAQVVAKLSQSGDPLDKKGDLRGISPVIMVKSGIHSVDILINEPANNLHKGEQANGR